MNQQKVAKRLNVTQATISRWLSGKSKPTGLYLEKLKEHPELLKRILKCQQT